MIPILYEENEITFDTNGLGRLADAASCKVEENRNGSYELKMEYPIDGIHYSDIQHSRIISAVPADGKERQPFRIYKISKPIKGIVTINAEHISYQMSHIPVIPFVANNAAQALDMMKANAAEECPFAFWTDIATTAKMSVTEPQSMRSLLGGQAGSVLDVYGGEWEFDGFTAKLHKERGFDRGVALRYGKNITDLKQEENIQNTYTGIMPYWKASDENDPEVVMLSEKVVRSDKTANYPYKRTIPVDFTSTFKEKPSQEKLRTAAKNYVKNNEVGVPKISIKVSFVALWQTEEYKDIAPLERVNLCDTVTVEFPALGVHTKAKVVKTIYNVLYDRYDSIELGENRATFSSTVGERLSETGAQIRNAESTFRAAINTATQLIQGGLGGNVVINHNADGKPNEIMIMDADDKETAVNVLRINMNGIGFSQSGYEGPFTSAWTLDGNFNADFITTGTLTAITIVGSLFQTATKGKRIVMDSSSSIKGLDGGTMYNAINMENDSHQLTIDAKSQLTIRAPKVAVVAKSYGTGGGDATVAKTGGTTVVTNVKKNTKRGTGRMDPKEVGLKDTGWDDCDVYCILPALLDVTYSDINSIHGMITTNKTVKTETIG